MNRAAYQPFDSAGNKYGELTPNKEPVESQERFGPYLIHARSICQPPCPFHAPSDHPLKDAPIHVRSDKGFLVERTCEHGVGHDDPDSVAYMHAHGHKWAGVHGCDGCCTKQGEQTR